MSTSKLRRAGRGHLHDALLYDSAAELTAAAVPFLLDGLAAGDAAVIAASARTAALLCEAVDDDPRVQVLERSAVYRERTPTAITAFRRLAQERAAEGSGRVRLVGEVDFGPTERDWLEWQRYEAVINDALAAWPLWGCASSTPSGSPTGSSTPHCGLTPPSSPPRAADPTRCSATPGDICARYRHHGSHWRTRRRGSLPGTSRTSSVFGTPSPPNLPPWTLPGRYSRTS
ncbi:MAG: MEDS domain-containing protein [Chloroflexota bacterium]|nr:MEDS domain-containing protein [Chloroflexota bacterium]